MLVADENVHRREIAVQQLSAMQLAEHLENAGDLAPDRRFGPARTALPEIEAQVTEARVLQRQAALQHRTLWRDQWKRVEDAHRAWMAVEQLTEVRLAQPAVDSGAHLDAER